VSSHKRTILLKIRVDYREKASGIIDLRKTDVVPLRGGYRPKRMNHPAVLLKAGQGIHYKISPSLPPPSLSYWSLPGQEVIEHFRSVSRVINASIEELMKIDGLGRVSAEKIREALDEEPG